MRTPTLPLVSVLALALAACGDARRPPAFQVLATVNGVPISERDVAHRAARPGMAAAMPGHAVPTEVLPGVVQDELAFQRAMELGLDRDREYRARVEDLEAQVRTFKRQELASRLRTWVQEQVPVTEREAREYWDRNGELIRTRYHVLQILRRGGPEQIAADRAAIAAGTPFEEIALGRFPAGSADAQARPPYDLGELGWTQLPPAWRGVVDRLAPGEVSEVVKGTGDRYWILKLAGKRIDPAGSFESERPRIEADLRQRKAEEAWARTMAGLNASATIVYTPVDRSVAAARPRGHADAE